MNLDTINKLYLELSQVATAKTAREIELEDLLTSARAICQRFGADTAWRRFDERIAKLGIGCVTPRVFKVLFPVEKQFAVGDIVQNESGSQSSHGCPLVCGSGAYDYAIVVSVDPFVLVSRAGDMLWSCIGEDRREHLVVIGHATEEESKAAFERYRSGR